MEECDIVESVDGFLVEPTTSASSFVSSTSWSPPRPRSHPQSDDNDGGEDEIMDLDSVRRELSIVSEALKEKAADLNARERIVEARVADLADRENVVKENESMRLEMSELSAALKQKSEDLSARERALEDDAADLESRKRSLEGYSKDLKAREQALDEDAKLMESRIHAQVEDRAALLQEDWESKVKEGKRAVRAKDREIRSMRKAISEMSAKIKAAERKAERALDKSAASEAEVEKAKQAHAALKARAKVERWKLEKERETWEREKAAAAKERHQHHAQSHQSQTLPESFSSPASTDSGDASVVRFIHELLRASDAAKDVSAAAVLPGLCRLASSGASHVADSGSFHARLLTFAWNLLQSEPCQSAPPSTMRQIRKFARILCGRGHRAAEREEDDEEAEEASSPSRKEVAKKRQAKRGGLIRSLDPNVRVLASLITVKFSDWRRSGTAMDDISTGLRVILDSAEDPNRENDRMFIRNVFSAVLPILEQAHDPALRGIVKLAVRTSYVIVHHASTSKHATQWVKKSIQWSMLPYASACSCVFSALAAIGPETSSSKTCLEAGGLLVMLLENLTSPLSSDSSGKQQKSAWAALESLDVPGKLKESLRVVTTSLTSRADLKDDAEFFAMNGEAALKRAPRRNNKKSAGRA